MRIVTIATIFRDRRVFPKIRSTLLGMTAEARVIQRLLNELQIIGLAVIAVTAAAIHFALTNWVGVRFQRLSTLLLMAVKAHLRLCCCNQNRILSRVARMAIRAGNLVDVMVITVPAKSRVRGMAVHTQAVLGINRCRRSCSEYGPWGGAFIAPANASGMIAGRAVASFALQLAVSERPVRVGRIGMSAFEQNEDGIILMAGEATISALPAVVGVLAGSGTGGQDT